MDFYNISFVSEKSQIIKTLNELKSPGYICFVNPNIFVNAYIDKNYKQIISNSTLNICDSMSINFVYNFLIQIKKLYFILVQIFFMTPSRIKILNKC